MSFAATDTPPPRAEGPQGRVDERAIAHAQTDLVAAVGDPAFPKRLLETLRVLAGVELCSVFLRDGGERVELILADGEVAGLPGFTLRASYAYARDFWRSDRQLARLAHAPAGAPVVTRRRAADIADPAYRSVCYDRAHVSERVSIVSPGRPCFVVNGYRTAGNAAFAAHDIDRLDLHAGFLIAALRQHLRAGLSPAVPTDEVGLAGRLAALDCGLSAREAEIVAALILGETQDRIARAKRLSPATVVTYRRRAYGKLGVGNRRDLMALHRRLASGAEWMRVKREGE